MQILLHQKAFKKSDYNRLYYILYRLKLTHVIRTKLGVAHDRAKTFPDPEQLVTTTNYKVAGFVVMNIRYFRHAAAIVSSGSSLLFPAAPGEEVWRHYAAARVLVLLV